MPMTIREYLSYKFPPFRYHSPVGQPTLNHGWYDISGLTLDEEITMETIEKLYKKFLDYRPSSHKLPKPHDLLEGELDVFSEDEIEHGLTQTKIFLVNRAYKAVYSQLRKEKSTPKGEFKHVPFIARGKKARSQTPGSQWNPDWVLVSPEHQSEGRYRPLLVGDTKDPNKWTPRTFVESLQTAAQLVQQRPLNQVATYMIENDVRYGFLLTGGDALFLRLVYLPISMGIATSRAARVSNVSTYASRRAFSGESTVSSLQAMSIDDPVYSNEGKPREFDVFYSPIPEEFTQIFLFAWGMMAAAPWTSKAIQTEYYPLHSYIKVDTCYRHTSTGLIKDKLKSRDKEVFHVMSPESPEPSGGAGGAGDVRDVGGASQATTGVATQPTSGVVWQVVHHVNGRYYYNAYGATTYYRQFNDGGRQYFVDTRLLDNNMNVEVNLPEGSSFVAAEDTIVGEDEDDDDDDEDEDDDEDDDEGDDGV